MNRKQKMAWFMIICILTALAISMATFMILYPRKGIPNAFIAFSFMGLASFGGLGPAIFKPTEDEKRVGADERDRLIQLKAARAGFACSYLYVGIISFVIWIIVGREGAVRASFLPGIYFIGAMLTAFFTQSIYILASYGWTNGNG